VKFAKTVAEVEVRLHPDWFTMSEKILATNIKIRNATPKTYTNNPSELNQLKLKEARSSLQREKIKQRKMARTLCKKMPMQKL